LILKTGNNYFWPVNIISDMSKTGMSWHNHAVDSSVFVNVDVVFVYVTVYGGRSRVAWIPRARHCQTIPRRAMHLGPSGAILSLFQHWRNRATASITCMRLDICPHGYAIHVAKDFNIHVRKRSIPTWIPGRLQINVRFGNIEHQHLTPWHNALCPVLFVFVYVLLHFVCLFAIFVPCNCYNIFGWVPLYFVRSAVDSSFNNLTSSFMDGEWRRKCKIQQQWWYLWT
jgi:hypothetical protein